MELQGGRVGLRSKEGGGPTIAFFLKTYQTAAPGQLVHDTISRTVETSLRNFLCERSHHYQMSTSMATNISAHGFDLVVDDSKLNQLVIAKQLRKKLYTADTAANGEEALALLAKYNTKKGKGKEGNQIAVVFLDDHVRCNGRSVSI